MKRCLAITISVLLIGLATTGTAAAKKDKGNPGRVLSGKVVNRDDQPLPNAVVYLSNTRTRAVKTYIVGADGLYHFPALSPNIDYEVYAQYSGKKSDTKTVSQFDERPQLNINLKIDTK